MAGTYVLPEWSDTVNATVSLSGEWINEREHNLISLQRLRKHNLKCVLVDQKIWSADGLTLTTELLRKEINGI